MSARGHFRFPWLDLSILAALLCLGWAAFQLVRTEPQILEEGQEVRDLRELFTECQVLFKDKESINPPELVRRESDLLWHEASVVKGEYLILADRLQSDLAGVELALREASTSKTRPAMPQKMRDLDNWLDKQKERALVERLASRSKELQGRVAAARISDTNGPVAITEDLGTLLEAIVETHKRYLSDFREVTNNVGKPLVAAFVAQHLDGAITAVARLSDLADRARRDGKAIEQFLETQSRSDAGKRTRRQEEVIHAFAQAGSLGEFVRRTRLEPEPGRAAAAVHAGQEQSLRPVRWALLSAVAGLGVMLIVDLYRRAVVVPLRTKLAERDTIIEYQKKLAHFEQLAAGLAHEIRNPLTTISARLYTIQRKLQEGTPEHNDASVIGSEIERANRILKEFILLTRPTPPKLEVVAAGPLLHDICDLMAPQLQQQSVQLKCESQGRAQCQADPQQIKQVLVNLIQNAAESMDHGGVITVRAQSGPRLFKGAQTKVVIIEVEDNGSGIRPEVQGRLFDPFFSTKKGGTGLGLPISARIIDRHGGSLDFESEVGEGTVFRILLPAYEEG